MGKNVRRKPRPQPPTGIGETQICAGIVTTERIAIHVKD